MDTETYDPHLLENGPGGYRGDGRLLGISIAVDGWSCYLPLTHPVIGNDYNMDINTVRRWFNDQMTRRNQPKVGARIIYDLEWLDSSGFELSGPFYDVQVAEPLLDEYRKTYHLLGLCQQYLSEKDWKITNQLEVDAEQYIGKFKGDVRKYLWQLPADVVAPYGEMDAISTLKVFKKQFPLITSQGLDNVFNIETSLIPMLLEMRKKGIRINMKKAKKNMAVLQESERDAMKEIKDLVGWELAIRSPDDLQKAYDKLKIDYPLTKKTKKASITSDWLQNQDDPLSSLILKTRRINTAWNNFIEKGIFQHVCDGRIYCTFNQLRSDEYGTVSGRFSSSQPNLQQQPGRTESFSEQIRELYVPDSGEQWWQIDWSQIEYRFMVHYAYIRGLRKANVARDKYCDNPKTDFHQMVADLCGIDRKPAKNINFGLAYAMGKSKLAVKLGLPKAETDIIFKKYFEETPFISLLLEDVGKRADAKGYITTILGRRARFDLWEPKGNYKGKEDYKEPFNHDLAVSAYGENVVRARTYTALNRLIQGSAADLMKLAMVKTYESGVYGILGIPGITVHDELDGSMPKTKEAKKALMETANIMETCLKLEVPIATDVAIGPDWYHVKDIER